MKFAEVVKKILKEYIVKEGDAFDNILVLNIFQDLVGVESLIKIEPKEYGKSTEWMDIVKEFVPEVKRLKKEIALQKNRKLTEEETDIIENVWYDGSDAYDSVEESIDSLPAIYQAQIEAIDSIL